MDHIRCDAYFPIVFPKSLGERLQTSSANPLGVYDAGTALWAQGKGKQEQSDDQNQATAEDQRVAKLSEKTGDFNRRLREEPADTQLWLEFIRYQVRSYLNINVPLICIQN